MKKYCLPISIVVNIILISIILNPVKQNTYIEKALINKIREQHKADEERILKDSLRIINEIKIRDKKINKLYKIRANERNLYQLEISKIQLLTTDSSYGAAIDSIKKVCCSDTGR